VRNSKNPTLFNEIFYKKIEENGVKLTIEPGWMTTPPVLRVTGDLEKILHATITESDIRAKKFSEITYSLGLGALGADVKDAMPVLGEMITLYGSMVWLPTDGNNTPDFLTPRTVPVRFRYIPATNITLDGPFNEYLTLETENPRGVSLSEIYRAIFSGARERVKSYHGAVAVTIWGVLDNLASSGLKRSPARESRKGPRSWSPHSSTSGSPRIPAMSIKETRSSVSGWRLISPTISRTSRKRTSRTCITQIP